MAKRSRAIKRLQGWRPKGIEEYRSGHRYFEESDIDKIVAVVRIPLPNDKVERTAALMDRLNSAAHLWVMTASWQELPRARDQVAAFEGVTNAADALIVALGLDGRGDEEDLPDGIKHELQHSASLWCRRHGDLGIFEAFRTGKRGEKISDSRTAASAARAAVECISRLRDWSDMAAKRHALRLNSDHSVGRPPDDATRATIGNLIDIWADIWERKPRTSVGSEFSKKPGQPTGPFFRFCRAFIDHVATKPPITDDALRDKIRSVIRMRRRKGKTDKPTT